jgi:hypothetical protein
MNDVAKLNDIEHRVERLFLCALVAVVCGLGGMYFYFLSSSVVHVVMNRESEEKMHKVHSEIASLEAIYMEKQHAISMEVARRHGYVASGKKIFLDRNDTSVVTRR